MSDIEKSVEDLVSAQELLSNQITKMRTNYGKDSAARKTPQYLQRRQKTLEEHWEEFKKTHNEIMRLYSKEDEKMAYHKNDKFSAVEQLYVEFASEIDVYLATNFPEPNVPVQTNNTNRSELRLPTITIPTFSGDYQTWTSFHDMFVSLIHENQGISKVQKLHYLKSNITGEAERLLRLFAITEANYDSAWNTLVSRYENKRALVNTQLTKLLSQKPIHTECPDAIKNLIDTTHECLQMLENLGIDASSWDAIVIHITTQKLPTETHQLWEQSISSSNELSTFEELKKFLEARFRTLEILGCNKTTKADTRFQYSKDKSNSTKVKTLYNANHTQHTKSFSRCCLCEQNHNIRQCPKFQKLDVTNRLEIVRKKTLCMNCLTQGHSVSACYSTKNCGFCGQRHHLLLHRKEKIQQPRSQPTHFNTAPTASGSNSAESAAANSTVNRPSRHSNNISSFYCDTNASKILLATALVKITTKTGTHILRALLDQGSQASFITENAVQRFKLPKIGISAQITGLGETTTGVCHNQTHFDIMSLNQEKVTIKLDALVIKTITGFTPTTTMNRANWDHLKGLTLADPDYHKPGKIDILLGAEVYAAILKDGIRKGPANTPVAQNTSLGWILSGKVANRTIKKEVTISNFHTRMETDQLLRKFWEIEEIQKTSNETIEEKECEEMFRNTHSRNNDGRYIVNLPFNTDTTYKLGKSRNIALARLLQLERRFKLQPTLKQDYVKCIEEYISLGHMTVAKNSETELKIGSDNQSDRYCCYYLPHHPVIKESSTTTKLRVVFNASQKTSTGVSLNDLIMTGATIQDDLTSILLRWRMFYVAFSADIEKMYRQIGITKQHQKYQRILWRKNTIDPIKDYELTTVTFGMTSAPFLAIRSLRQLAYDEANRFPIASDATINDFYVDNILSGADTEKEAIQKQDQLLQMLQNGGFPLKKWSSNNKALIRRLPEDHRELASDTELNLSDNVKTLGVYWNPLEDVFLFKINLDTLDRKQLTKRTILSEVAKVFDPLGWLAPVIITGKIIMQKLWLAGLNWDDETPTDIVNMFLQYRNDLKQLETIRIPRWLGTTSTQSTIEIHSFCDASTLAYAAAVYLRVGDDQNKGQIHLLAAKTKVAPIKTVSLPRLELCGAALLVKLTNSIITSLKLENIVVHAWTDSTIVLAWLKGHPNRWKTFVANRVSEIRNTLPSALWKHVSSADNPADCASRGCCARELQEHKTWWKGPKWLTETKEAWPTQSIKLIETELEIKKSNVMTTTVIRPFLLINQYSSLKKLIRVMAYILRFCNNTRNPKHKIVETFLLANELKKSIHTLVKICQQHDFTTELTNLRKKRQLHKNSRLINLNPILHEDGLIRVGGRLRNASIPFEQKHPIILHNKNYLTELIIRDTHLNAFHAGTQLTSNLLRQNYWILSSRNTVRKIIHQCTICHRHKATTGQQMMGNLPTSRTNIARPFSHTGVDYCGPFTVRMSKGRGSKLYKGYISIFVCMTVKAIHIEFVSDMTTPSFIAAFKRFSSRRGLPTDMYSDCGTNFIGASRTLDKELATCLKNMSKEVAGTVANDGVKWHFNPPAAPNFGGLWEAGVKATKYHLKRVLRNTTLTFEEMYTVLTQIEANLNSRPLCPLSNDPEDDTALTPGHFLIGAPLRNPAEPSLLQIQENRLNRWQFVQQLNQHFWKRWKEEYLTQLQQRPKWITQTRNIEIGNLVLIKEDNLPPGCWLLGRVTETHPGTDNLVRVVTVKTKNGLLKRPINKLSILPTSEDEETHSINKEPSA